MRNERIISILFPLVQQIQINLSRDLAFNVDGMFFAILVVRILLFGSVFMLEIGPENEVHRSNVSLNNDNGTKETTEEPTDRGSTENNHYKKDCVRKTRLYACCPLDRAKKLNKDGCFEYTRKDILVNTTSVDQLPSASVLKLNDLRYEFVVDFPCDRMTILEHNEFDDEQWFFHSNGSIKVVNPEIGWKHLDDYCLVNVIDDNSTLIGTFAYHCFRPTPTNVRLTVYAIGMLTSLPFLCMTFLVYIVIPELRNLPGKILLCYLSALISSFVSLSISQLRIVQTLSLSCKILGFWSYFSLMTTFFWLHVMCFDIWRNITTKINILDRRQECRRLRKYFGYAYGFPIILVLVAYIVDSSCVDGFWKPGIGTVGCFLRDQWTSLLIYYHGPITLIFSSNICLCINTACAIYKFKTELDNAITSETSVQNSTQTDKERFFLFLRLITLMGFMWIMESVSWMFGDKSYLFYITDFLNGIQGIFIFILFVCRPKIKRLIKKRWRNLTTS